jgi:hypothetical protein
VNIALLTPAIEQKLQFKMKFRKMVPGASGCYALASFEGEVLYVGLSDDLNRRFFEHVESPDKVALTTDGRAFWFAYKLCAAKELNRTERNWMHQFADAHGRLPVLNKVSSPII